MRLVGREGRGYGWKSWMREALFESELDLGQEILMLRIRSSYLFLMIEKRGSSFTPLFSRISLPSRVTIRHSFTKLPA
jgi:hypothetical protein